MNSEGLRTLGAHQIARTLCLGEKNRDDFPTGGNREMHGKEYVDLTSTGSSSVSIPVSRQDPVPSQVASWLRKGLTIMPPGQPRGWLI